jgi:hypothetical protein
MNAEKLKKGGKLTMTYSKPEVTKIGCAIKAIQSGQMKPFPPITDSTNLHSYSVGAAYEADE